MSCLRASTEVLTEINKKDDGLAEYFKDRSDMFVEINDDTIQHRVIEILKKYPVWLILEKIETRRTLSSSHMLKQDHPIIRL